MNHSFCARCWRWLAPMLVVLMIALTGGEGLAAEQTGRISLLGMLGEATTGEQTDSLGAHQQSLRLMWQGDHSQNGRWQFHSKISHQYQRGFTANLPHSSQWFRRKALSGDWFAQRDHDSARGLRWEVDRAFYEYRFNKVELRLGRQAIDWGSGRFWQPLNVFGAFAPVALDTEYKPGVDALVASWYPGAFSSLTAALVFSPDNMSTHHSGALHYRNRIGEQAELSLLAGDVLGNKVIGAGLESEWKGMGWRIEASYQDLQGSAEKAFWFVGGIDYQFENGTTVTAEWYENDVGASKISELAGVQTQALFQRGLLPHLSKRVLALSAGREIMPLLKGQYTVLAGRLEDDTNNSTSGQSTSLLHQLNLTYSLSNESELLFSLAVPNGKGLGSQGQLQSEFGHLPASVVLQYRHYF